MDQIPFNLPPVTGHEMKYIQEALAGRKLSADGPFTKKCTDFFEKHYGFHKTLLTTSCTDALELCSLLCDLREGDEVIMPSYTFVSTANPFMMRGAKIVFCDSGVANPNIDAPAIAALITDRTRAIVPVHYAGIACDMDTIMLLAEKHDLVVIEDAAQAIDAYHRDKPLGSLGHLAAFSFHETKNIISGEGGMAVISDARYAARAEMIYEKGTNRLKFLKGEIDKYDWVDTGSSFAPSDLIAAYLLAQLEGLRTIQQQRQALWHTYHMRLQLLSGRIQLPHLPPYATHNAHMYYIGCESGRQRTELMAYLAGYGIHSVFHYQALHRSPFFAPRHDGRPLPQADRWTDTLLRLPLFFDLKIEQVNLICDKIIAFFGV